MTNVSPLHSNLHLIDAYLKPRGLERSDLVAIGGAKIVDPLDREFYKTHRFGIQAAYNRTGLLLTYLDPQGKPYLDAFEPGGELIPYSLIRYLTPPLGVPVGTEVRKINSQWGRPSRLHFQPLETGAPWEELPEGSIVLHTESMIKAIVTSKYLGLASIGYNGVQGFTSSRIGMELIHKYVDFDFSKYTNVILFDSNVVGNDDVARARQQLCHKMRHILGCDRIKLVDLPKPLEGEVAAGDVDWGPDDFIMKRGADALMKLIAEAVPYEDEKYSDLVEEMNDRARWVDNLNAVLDRKTGAVITINAARNKYSPINRVLKDVKGGRVSRIYGMDEWMGSSNRNYVDEVSYRYLEDEFFEHKGKLVGNLYRPGGAEPSGAAEFREEGTKLYLELLTTMMSEADLRLFRAYLKFLKYGKDKPTSYPVLWSNKRGVGKGLTTTFASALLGEGNVGVTSGDQLAGSSNDHVAAKRLVVLNDIKVKGSNRDTVLGFIKSFIGDEKMPVKALYLGVYSVENRAGIIVSVNDRTDMPSDGLEDRRQWYVECHGPVWPGEDERWTKVWAGMRDDRVLSELAQWVKDGDDVDFTSWRPEVTAQRVEDLMMGRPVAEQLCAELRAEFRELGIRLCTMAQIKSRAEELGYDMSWYDPRRMKGFLHATGWESPKEFARIGASKVQGWTPFSYEEIVQSAGGINRGDSSGVPPKVVFNVAEELRNTGKTLGLSIADKGKY